MPTCSFSVVVPVESSVAWKYVADYENVIEWDSTVRSAEKDASEASEGAWDVRMDEFPNMKFTCTRETERLAWSGPSQTIAFVLESSSDKICIRESFIVESCEGGSRISYKMHLGSYGWRNIPCVRGATWIRLRSRSASTTKTFQDTIARYAKSSGASV